MFKDKHLEHAVEINIFTDFISFKKQFIFNLIQNSNYKRLLTLIHKSNQVYSSNPWLKFYLKISERKLEKKRKKKVKISIVR